MNQQQSKLFHLILIYILLNFIRYLLNFMQF